MCDSLTIDTKWRSQNVLIMSSQLLTELFVFVAC